MTEEEWKQCRDPRLMLRAMYEVNPLRYPDQPLTGPYDEYAISEEKHHEVSAAIESASAGRNCASGRKHLLFASACCRRIEHLLLPEERRLLLDLHDLDADDQLRPKQEANARRKLKAAVISHRDPDDARGSAGVYVAATEAADWLLLGLHDTNQMALLDEIDDVVRRDPEYTGGPDGEGPHQAAILRDIWGTPYTPVRFVKSWRTDTAVSLARTMYESREFGAMPILADALQDAGCDSEDILNHCRDANQAHVRGCWVVDLVLGKA